MSKKSKKERKSAREAQRAEVRRQERQRNLFTVIVIGIVLALGGVLVWVSLGNDDLDDLLAELEEQQTPDPDEGSEEPESVETVDPASDERPIACGADLPERAGETKSTYTGPEQVVEDGVDYQAVVETSCGRIVIDLDTEGAPEGANAFVFLATEGFYDGLEIFRHAAGIGVFQTGSGTNEAAFSIGYQLPDELDPISDSGYPPGSVAYANAGPGTSGSQFFFVYDDSFQSTVDSGGLQPIYTRFGTVVEGLDILETMAGIEVAGEQPQERVYMESVTIMAGGQPLDAAPEEGDR